MIVYGNTVQHRKKTIKLLRHKWFQSQKHGTIYRIDNSIVNCNTVITFEIHISRWYYNYTEYRAALEPEMNENFDC